MLNHDLDLKRMLVEATVDRALRDLQRDSKRSLRNLVDLGLNFCKGPYVTRFLEGARNMLSDEQSAYFEAVQTALRNTDPEILKTFGVNVGLEGCMRGADRIRKLEAERDFNIPWALTICAGEKGLSLEDCHRLVDQGKALGIHCYLLLDYGLDGAGLQELAGSHPKCAFAVLTGDLCSDPNDMLYLMAPQNVLYLLDADGEGLLDALNNLHANRGLFGLYRWYGNDAPKEALSEALLAQCRDAGALFLAMIPRPGTGPAAGTEMNRQIVALRTAQQQPFCPFELGGDLFWIDTIISGDGCTVAVCPDGQIFTAREGRLEGQDRNLRSAPLDRVLALAVPKGKG